MHRAALPVTQGYAAISGTTDLRDAVPRGLQGTHRCPQQRAKLLITPVGKVRCLRGASIGDLQSVD